MDHYVSIEHRDAAVYPAVEDMLQQSDFYVEIKAVYGISENVVSDMVRSCFVRLELDQDHYGSEAWNPLGDGIVQPGNTVLVKPNMVLDRNDSGGGTDCMFTHPSLVAAMVPYIWKALAGEGRIIVADAPVQSCDFDKLVSESGYRYLVDHFREKGMNIELKDLRGLVSKESGGILVADILSDTGILVDLKEHSEHANLTAESIRKARITNYDPDELNSHHDLNRHEYLIAAEALEADVIINMPKPKAHRKAGVTIGMKNFVGVNTRKEYLPHHRMGDAAHGGDEYAVPSCLLSAYSRLLDVSNRAKGRKRYSIARFLRLTSRGFSLADKHIGSRQRYREGSWYGNDTIWRTIVDINKIIRYGDKQGVMQPVPQRKVFTVADMIVVGEKEGPLLPSPKYAGVIAMGENLACFDEAAATLLGLDIHKIPLYRHLRESREYPLVGSEEAVLLSNVDAWNKRKIQELDPDFAINIEPTQGWKGYIERR